MLRQQCTVEQQCTGTICVKLNSCERCRVCRCRQYLKITLIPGQMGSACNSRKFWVIDSPVKDWYNYSFPDVGKFSDSEFLGTSLALILEVHIQLEVLMMLNLRYAELFIITRTSFLIRALSTEITFGRAILELYIELIAPSGGLLRD
ncbi:hypothetical protein CEXT_689271 [Caerostris extrusa]|uniref:Uncharacterized protein n=1 Tax=Caerostris extrusa TaxID=172846 RepID=A0AAV4RR24_CAEEX|nr:hypothetical protein CEXT_689271 [Caerostris extrusa]